MNIVIGAAIVVNRSPNPGILTPKLVNEVGTKTVVPWIEAVGSLVGGEMGVEGKNEGVRVGKDSVG